MTDGEIECVDTGAAGRLAMVVGVDSARGVDRAVPVVAITGHGIERGVVGSVDNQIEGVGAWAAIGIII